MGLRLLLGFLGGESGQWDPVITENQKTIGVPEGKEGQPYYLPDDMADRTVEWLHGVRAQDQSKPWFVYFSTGCSHAPHHVPKAWADKYKGRFDEGWNRLREETLERQKRLGVVPVDAELTPRNDAFPAWESLGEDQRRLYARQMEVYAGYQENADHNVGRVLDAVAEMGELDDTLVIWIWGDNGSSLEGTLTGSFNELTMQNGIPQPTHVDGIEQEPMHGLSFADSFADAAAPEHRTQQYFEIFGNRAIYKRRRRPRAPHPAVLRDLRQPRHLQGRLVAGDDDAAHPVGRHARHDAQVRPWRMGPDSDPAELYYLPDDFTQARNLAADHPEKVAELQRLFWQEAERYKVLPLMGGMSVYFGVVPPMPTQSRFTFYGDVQNVASGMIPRIYNHSYTISAELQVPEGGAKGVIVAVADHLGGFSLFVQDGKLQHTYSMMGVSVFHQEAAGPLPTGEVTVQLVFAADAAKPATGGEVTLLVNDKPVGGGRMDRTVPFRFSGYSGMDVGRDNGLPVDRRYADKSPFAFTGTVRKVVFDINPHLDEDDEQALLEHAQRSLAAHGLSA